MRKVRTKNNFFLYFAGDDKLIFHAKPELCYAESHIRPFHLSTEAIYFFSYLLLLLYCALANERK